MHLESTGKIQLSWNTVTNAEHYELWGSTSPNGTFTRMWSGSATAIKHNSIQPGVTYYYKLRAVAGERKSAFSAVVSGTCRLAQPTVTVSNNASTGKPVIRWTSVAGAQKYEIWGCTTQNGSYKKLGTVTGTSVTHSSATAGKTYYYKVRAIAGDMKGAASAVVGKTCDLARPTLTALLNAEGEVFLSWTKVTGAVRYEVYRSTSQNGTYTKLWEGTSTMLINSSVKNGVTYYYKVRAVASVSSATGAFSAIKSVAVK